MNAVVIIMLIIGALLALPACQKEHTASPRKNTKKQTRIYLPLKKKQAAFEAVTRMYAPVLPLIATIDFPTTKLRLKEHIMLQNDVYNKRKSNALLDASYYDLPFVQYKWLLDKHIRQLQRYAGKLTQKADNQGTVLEGDIQGLIAQLEQLNEIIVKSEEYRQEKLALASQGRMNTFGILKFGFGTVLRKLIFV